MRTLARHTPRWSTACALPVAAICFVALMTGTAAACPTCKQAIAANGDDIVRGYFWSILFMMAMPFTILGSLSSYMYLLVRRARKEQKPASIGSRAGNASAIRDSSPKAHEPAERVTDEVEETVEV